MLLSAAMRLLLAFGPFGAAVDGLLNGSSLRNPDRLISTGE
jgi:hypothetical protein